MVKHTLAVEQQKKQYFLHDTFKVWAQSPGGSEVIKWLQDQSTKQSTSGDEPSGQPKSPKPVCIWFGSGTHCKQISNKRCYANYWQGAAAHMRIAMAWDA